jgi:hypothetical protein
MLSQPVDRMRIWREKWTVTMFAVLSAAAVNCFASRAMSHEDTELGVFVTVWSAAVVGGAALPLLDRLRPFWITSLEAAPAGMKLSIVGFEGAHETPFYFIIVWLLSFAAFWCASAVNSTMKAVLWIFPVVTVLVLAGAIGVAVGEGLAGTRILDLAVYRFHPFPFTSAVLSIFRQAAWFWLIAPALLLVLIQSYRLFRMQPQESVRSVIRHVLPLAILTFVCGSSVGVLSAFVNRPYQHASLVVRETSEAIQKQFPGITGEFTPEDLTRTSSFSELTRQWLDHSTIAVGYNPRFFGAFTTIHFPSGLDCTRYVRPAAWRCTAPDHRWWGSFVTNSEAEYYLPRTLPGGLAGNVIRVL